MAAVGYSDDIEDAQQLDYVAVLHRHPFATDAYELGYATGLREDYGLQVDDYPNADPPVIMLDNDFRDPDVDRYLDLFNRYDPSVAFLGDAYGRREAEQLNDIGAALKEKYPYKEVGVVPKYEPGPDGFEELHPGLMVGVAAASTYGDVLSSDVADASAYRGRKVHILGGSPPKQWRIIQELTQPTLDQQPPADVKGIDWNGMVLGAYKGEYWSRDGWQRADHLSIRETVRESLLEIKAFWEDWDVWPETEPRDLYGPAVQEPDELIFMDRGGDPIPDRDALESAYVETYDGGETWAYESETQKKHIEYYEGLL